ncbi:MAG: CapA family protein [Bdellovibrionota bacterium]
MIRYKYYFSNRLFFSYLSYFFILIGVSSCVRFRNVGLDDSSGGKAVGESGSFYEEQVSVGNESAKPLDASQILELIDIRGVGDSGWVDRSAKPENVTGIPVQPMFGQAIKEIDPEKIIFASDLSFINWEAVITQKCSFIRKSVSFAFYSHPENIIQAAERGFNLFGISNNHSGDCEKDENGFERADAFNPSIRYIEKKLKTRIALAGAGENFDDIQIFEKLIKDRKVTVAFGSISFFGWDIPKTNVVTVSRRGYDDLKVNRYLKKFDESNADIKILSIHTQDGSNSTIEAEAFIAAKETGEKFIKYFRGNVVFGHGPHTWAGVKIVHRLDGTRGVLFSSLGNFVHQGLSIRKDNYLGRVLLDPNDNFTVKQVYVFPLVNKKTTISFYSDRNIIPAPISNFSWYKGAYQNGNLAFYFADFQ